MNKKGWRQLTFSVVDVVFQEERIGQTGDAGGGTAPHRPRQAKDGGMVLQVLPHSRHVSHHRDLGSEWRREG